MQKLNIDKKDRNIEAIAKIIELTRNDSLRWKSISSSTVQKNKNSDIISSVFCSSYKQKILRIFKRQYQGIPTRPKSVLAFAITSNNSELSWYEETVLEIIDNNHVSLWVFPKEDILNDLLKTIKYKVSGAEDLINSLLDE